MAFVGQIALSRRHTTVAMRPLAARAPPTEMLLRLQLAAVLAVSVKADEECKDATGFHIPNYLVHSFSTAAAPSECSRVLSLLMMGADRQTACAMSIDAADRASLAGLGYPTGILPPPGFTSAHFMSEMCGCECASVCVDEVRLADGVNCAEWAHHGESELLCSRSFSTNDYKLLTINAMIGEATCEDHEYDQTACANVACCQFSIEHDVCYHDGSAVCWGSDPQMYSALSDEAFPDGWPPDGFSEDSLMSELCQCTCHGTCHDTAGVLANGPGP